jgi:hypothetical protein
MFAKIAKFWTMSPWPVARSAVALAHSNDNKVSTRGAAAACRAQRPVLACRWRPIISGGGLECRWNVEFAEGIATEEPDARWLVRRIYRLFGIETAGARVAVPAIG